MINNRWITFADTWFGETNSNKPMRFNFCDVCIYSDINTLRIVVSIPIICSAVQIWGMRQPKGTQIPIQIWTCGLYLNGYLRALWLPHSPDLVPCNFWLFPKMGTPIVACNPRKTQFLPIRTVEVGKLSDRWTWWYRTMRARHGNTSKYKKRDIFSKGLDTINFFGAVLRAMPKNLFFFVTLHFCFPGKVNVAGSRARRWLWDVCIFKPANNSPPTFHLIERRIFSNSQQCKFSDRTKEFFFQIPRVWSMSRRSWQ